jgi:hypothetical protein
MLNAVSAVLDQLNPDILKTSDGEALLKAAIGLGLEGVVSKKRGSPYRSGPCRDWVKVKARYGVRPIGSGGACFRGKGKEPPDLSALAIPCILLPRAAMARDGYRVRHPGACPAA